MKGFGMFKEGSPIVYGAPADLKKWPSLRGQRLNGQSRPYLVFSGTLAECVRELMSKPIRGISLYDIVTDPQPSFDQTVLSPGDAAEIAMRKDFPKA
jgi:hypothetical protein